MARVPLTSPVKGTQHSSYGSRQPKFDIAPAPDVLKGEEAALRFDEAFTRESRSERREQRAQSIDRIMRSNRAAGM